MYVFLLIRRGPQGVRVSARELGRALIGAALLFGGNGIVSVAEQSVPSALTALIIRRSLCGSSCFRGDGRSVSGKTALGVILGFSGVALLVVPGSTSGGAEGIGYVLLVLASLSWATGSFLSGKVALPRDPFTSTAVQMLCGGAVIAVAALVGGEFNDVDPSSFSLSSIAGLAYLIVFGSLIAFTAYTWLLQNGPISKVSTYAYVNPVVAVFLGWLILSEEITLMIGIGALLIIASVAFIVRNESRVSAPTVRGRCGRLGRNEREAGTAARPLRAAGPHVIGTVRGHDPDGGTGVGSLNHLTAADVHPDVVDQASVKQEIPGLPVALRHPRGRAVLGCGAVG